MRKTGKLLAVGLAMGCALCALSGCKDFDDYVPDEFGAWDGNYIYAGNVKSKTTGEDPETLVSKVEIEEKTYMVNGCADYQIVGEKLYLCLYISENAESESRTCLVEYDTQTKTPALLFVEQNVIVEDYKYIYDVDGVVKVLDDTVVLESDKQGWFAIDRTGAIVDGDCNDLKEYTAAGEYLYKWENSVLSYRTWTDETLVTAYDGTGTDAVSVTERYVKKDGCEGFILQTHDANNLWNGLCFYDLNAKTLTAFDVTGSGENIEWLENAPENEYFITYDFEWVQYTEKEGLFKKEAHETTLAQNCVLYRIVYGADGARLEKAYTFDKEKNYRDIQILCDGKIYGRAVWFVDSNGCTQGGRKQVNYRIDLESGEEERMFDRAFERATEKARQARAREAGVACGSYTYYIRTERLFTPSWFIEEYVYMLDRYDSDNGETEMMQIWADTARENEYCCEEMWKPWTNEYDEEPTMYAFIVKNT